MPAGLLTLLGAAALAAAPSPAQPGACPALRWTTLGTAGGPVPTAERGEPANLLVAGEGAYLVDTGDGTVNQLARQGLDLGAIGAVFISHHHSDHTGGLAAVIALRWMNQFPGVLTVYGPVGTRQMVDGIVASLQPQARIGFGLGAAPLPPAGSVRVLEMKDGDTVELGGMTVHAAANSHFDHPGPRAPDEPQSLSFRFQIGARSITYTGDTGPSPAVTALARGTDMLVSEVIALDQLIAEIRQRRADASPQMLTDMARHLSTHHLRPEEIGRMAAEAGARRVVLTHFAVPGPLAPSESALRGGVGTAYAGPVDLARDLSSFALGCN
ncbi:MBL fold metallo-hydrolase [Novosphingobium flavum]|uniref:MBL fold metallo-hydrolase n=1 Tax=Novosphingobium flavum TaxID=1778672 RepID=A0A7X1FTQ8_9SPHN|nr:MBL fold metallo-hydrolase [Novosphingobium flavum]MBC2666798.1 MBL fold metallo-hydrolase [Novosphingobium flavum]